MEPSPFSRFILGDEEQRKNFLANYMYDVSPSTDNDPFYFNFHKWSNLRGIFWYQKSRRPSGESVNPGRTKFPIGLSMLFLTLGQAILLSALFILYPLWKSRETIRATRHKGVFLLYFAALGFGFIFMEIALIQKYAILLGGPIYSFSITIFSILLFSGIGSFIAKAWRKEPERALGRVLGAIIALSLLTAVFVHWGFPFLLGLGQGLRIFAAILTTAPVGLLLGMAFPLGIRMVNATAPELVPWAWGVNACASVIGSVLSILISMHLGFLVVFLLTSAAYSVALLAVRLRAGAA